MNKKTTSSAVSAPVSTKPAKVADIRAETLELRDLRRGIYTGILEAAMERVWRNCLYPATVSFDQYYKMYARNNIAARVIETFPDYSWAAVPFPSDSRGATSRFSKAAGALLTRQYKLQDGVSQSLLTSMKQLDVLGGIGGESLLIFGFADGRMLDTQVQQKRDMEISWVKILHNGQFEVEKRDEDEASPTFGDVLLYRTKPFSATIDLNFSSQIAPGKSIHASRCVHFKESSGLSYGTSRIQKCYNQLLDITKLAGASAEVYWLGAFSGLSIETDPNASLSDDSYTRMKDETTKYFDGLARSLIFEGATSKLLYPAIVSPKDHFDLQITMISIATGIPRRFLTGAEAAKLASQQDTLNWMERVTNRREMFIGPKVVAPVIQRCIDAGVIPPPSENTFTVVWPRVQSIALNERADAARNMTAAWNAYGSSGMSEVMPFGVYLLYACGFSETEAEDIEAKIDASKWKKVQKASESGTTSPSTSSSAVKKLESRIEDLETGMEEVAGQSAPVAQVPRSEQIEKKPKRGEK